MKNNLQFLSLLFAISLFSLSVQGQQQLAFPGAEGFGRYAKGARASATADREVYHVTNLNDSGAGSLRDAISKPGRVIVFDVSGVINIKNRLVFSSNLYVAGQTAPGDGIIVYGNGVTFSGANDVIIRHIGFYMGKGGTKDKDTGGLANGKNMMFDHLTFAWGLDENFSINWDSKGSEPADITIQNSIIGQGILTHSAGGLIQTNGGISIIGCFYIDNSTRNPKVKGLNQFINNVVYNWGGTNGYIFGDTTADSWGWLEGNYFIAGPNSSSSPFTRTTSAFQLYQANNYVDSNKDGLANGTAAAASAFGSATIKADRSAFVNIPKEHPEIEGGILTPEQALAKVINSVGPFYYSRNHVDAYMIDELLSYGTEGKFIAHERENGIPNNIGVMASLTIPNTFDTNGDGIPDAWEERLGFNPAVNKATDIAPNGYMYIENYINSIDGPIFPYVRCVSKVEMESRTTSSLKITWRNNSPDADQILIQIAKDNEAFTDLTTVAGNVSSYNVTGLDEDTYYNFRFITKTSGLQDSPASGTFRETTMGPPKIPDTASEPTPGAGGTTRYYTSVDFTWEDTTRPWGGDITYDVYFGESADALTKIADGISEKMLTFTEGNMDMNTEYFWRVDNTNNMGTTTGDVWSFISGIYSFTTTYVDLGTDFDGTNSVNSQSGSSLTSSKTYTVNNEMTFTVSGSGATVSASDTKDNLYGNGNGSQSKIIYPYVKMTADSDYLQGALTSESTEKLIYSIKVNGTSSEPSDPAICYILFSDDSGFNTNSIIGYEEIEFPRVRWGNSGTTIYAPEGAKSFRIYRVVSIGIADENLWEINGRISPETLKGNGQLRIGYIGVSLQLESLDDRSNNSINSVSINGKTAVFNKDDNTFTYQFPKGTVLGNWPVTYELTSNLATADFVSGSNHNFANGPLTINVTAQDESIATYTVSATVSDQTTVGILTATGTAASYDDLFLSAFDGYNIQFLEAESTAPADINAFYEGCDLLVLHASVAGSNETALATKAMVGVKPVLNLKAYFYGNDRWDWGTPSNTEIGRVNSNVEVALQNHPIFENVTFDDDKLVLFAEPTTVINSFQYATMPLNGTAWTSQMTAANNVLATIDGDDTKAHIHELNMDISAKYLMIGLSNEDNTYTRFNANAVEMLKNATEYLLNPNIYYDYATNSVVGIQDNLVNSNITYWNGNIINPDMEDIIVFNSLGMSVLTSKDNLINVGQLGKGLYIAKAKTKTFKFIIK